MLHKYGKSTRDIWGRFYFYFSLVFLYFRGVFNKTIIPLAPACWIWDDFDKLGGTRSFDYHLMANVRSRGKLLHQMTEKCIKLKGTLFEFKMGKIYCIWLWRS